VHLADMYVYLAFITAHILMIVPQVQGFKYRRASGPSSPFPVTLTILFQFMVRKRILCDHCRGSGAASDGDIHTCSGCGGNGIKLVKQQIFPGMFAQSQVTCNECGGRGTMIRRMCPHCSGEKVLDHSAHYTLEVVPGMPEEHEIVFEGEGDESPDWEPGDVILKVRSRKETGGWRRKETSLYWKETIGVDEVGVFGVRH
jgi:DnaJ-related protein SCJ1